VRLALEERNPAESASGRCTRRHCDRPGHRPDHRLDPVISLIAASLHLGPAAGVGFTGTIEAVAREIMGEGTPRH